MLVPGKPAINIARDIFHLPNKPASGELDAWLARMAVTQDPSEFHLMIIPMFVTPNLKPANPLQVYHSETGQVETLPYLVSQGAFSSDGHWLLVTDHSKVLIRPIDPPGSAFQPFSDQGDPGTWSPDGSKYYLVSPDQTTVSVYSWPGGALLGNWQAPDYELSGSSWTPDGKSLCVWGREHNDYHQEAIFIIHIPG